MAIKYINRTTGNLETEQPPAEEVLNFLYDNPFGEKAVLPIVKQKFITEWYGKIMDSAASTNRIQPFIDSLKIDMTEVKKSVSEFVSFNDFFYRELKPGSRQIENGLVSPGDGKILAFENVSQVNTFYVKGRKFTLKEFLEEDELTDNYANAAMVILRLAPDDYHRYHFPYQGVPSQSADIEGVYYSVSPVGLEDNFTEIFCENKKQICTLQIENKGEILIIPVGATMVGSLNSTYQPNKLVEKGEEMGYFAFGGSTIVLLFDAKSFKLEEDLIRNTQNKLETYVKMGATIGTKI